MTDYATADGMTVDDRTKLIEQYADGYNEVMRALDGISESEWDNREAPGEWNAREIVHHLGDGEMNAAARIRMLVADQEPIIMNYDQDRWTAKLYTDKRPVDVSMIAFKAARDATLPLLQLMTDGEWKSQGKHSEAGAITAETWLTWYGPHAHDHADQIRRARKGSA
jgi:hypothetical protein